MSATHEQSTTDEELAAAITHARRHGWSTPRAREVLAEARRIFGPMAVRLGADPDDAVRIAWVLWATGLTEQKIVEVSGHLWAYTGTCVGRGILAEIAADEKHTSVTHARTKAAHSAQTVSIDADGRLQIAGVEPATAASDDEDEGGSISQILALAGLSPASRDVITNIIWEQVSQSVSVRAASAALTRIPAPSAARPLTDAQWRAAVALILGTPKGAPGIPRLLQDGHPFPLAEQHIRRAMGVLVPNIFADQLQELAA